MATTVFELAESNEVDNRPDAEVIHLREAKRKRIHEAAVRNGVAAKFDGVVFTCTRGEERARIQAQERARRATAAEAKAYAEAQAKARCACGMDVVFWRCDGRVDDGKLHPADPFDEARKMRACAAPLCAACVFKLGKEGFCKSCQPAALKQAEADAVDLEELDEVAPAEAEEPPVGPPGEGDGGDDGVEYDALVTAGETYIEDF